MRHHRTLATLLLIAFALLWSPRQMFAQIYSSPPPTAFAGGFDVVGFRTVASATVNTASTGYTTLPTITFSGGEATTQATGTCTLKAVGSVTIAAGGTGYSVGNVLTLSGGTSTTAATFTVSTVSTGAVTGVTITNAGAYTVPTTSGAATTGGAGSGCTLTVSWGVGSIIITNGGTGYHTTAPTITFSSGSAAATANFASQVTYNQGFKGFIPGVDTVVATYSGTNKAGKYVSTSLLPGKTFKAGVWYPFAGSSISVTSGYLWLAK
jgi:hypothetical protein